MKLKVDKEDLKDSIFYIRLLLEIADRQVCTETEYIDEEERDHIQTVLIRLAEALNETKLR